MDQVQRDRPPRIRFAGGQCWRGLGDEQQRPNADDDQNNAEAEQRFGCDKRTDFFYEESNRISKLLREIVFCLIVFHQIARTCSLEAIIFVRDKIMMKFKRAAPFVLDVRLA